MTHTNLTQNLYFLEGETETDFFCHTDHELLRVEWDAIAGHWYWEIESFPGFYPHLSHETVRYGSAATQEQAIWDCLRNYSRWLTFVDSCHWEMEQSWHDNFHPEDTEWWKVREHG